MELTLFKNREAYSSKFPLVNGGRLNNRIRELSEFGKKPEGGVSRVAYSDADIEARKYVRILMNKAKLKVHIDAAGNMIGRRAGKGHGLSPLMTGSHIDSVPRGGNYDGVIGVIGAIEVAQILEEKEINTRHPLEIVVFANEEGGKTGSRAMSGELTQKDLALKMYNSRTTNREGIKRIGGNPKRLREARRDPGDVVAFIEMHIEQGAVLEEESKNIGVVEGIAGIKRWAVTVEGFANHAGTTPMNGRRDALLAAARFVETVNEVIAHEPGRQVGTVGQIEVFPGAPNVIPGKAILSLEIRDLKMSKIDKLYNQIRLRTQHIGQEHGTTFSFDDIYTTKSAPTDSRINKLIAKSADELNLGYLTLPSGAGHDAKSIAQIAPIGMIFIPSIDGISHSPNEYSRPKDIEAGTNVLLHTLLEMDQKYD